MDMNRPSMMGLPDSPMSPQMFQTDPNAMMMNNAVQMNNLSMRSLSQQDQQNSYLNLIFDGNGIPRPEDFARYSGKAPNPVLEFFSSLDAASSRSNQQQQQQQQIPLSMQQEDLSPLINHPQAQSPNSASFAASKQSSEDKKKRKRYHAKKACANCRKAHTACSDQRPCDRCKKKKLVCLDSEDAGDMENDDTKSNEGSYLSPEDNSPTTAALEPTLLTTTTTTGTNPVTQTAAASFLQLSNNPFSNLNQLSPITSNLNQSSSSSNFNQSSSSSNPNQSSSSSNPSAIPKERERKRKPTSSDVEILSQELRNLREMIENNNTRHEKMFDNILNLVHGEVLAKKRKIELQSESNTGFGVITAEVSENSTSSGLELPSEFELPQQVVRLSPTEPTKLTFVIKILPTIQTSPQQPRPLGLVLTPQQQKPQNENNIHEIEDQDSETLPKNKRKEGMNE